MLIAAMLLIPSPANAEPFDVWRQCLNIRRAAYEQITREAGTPGMALSEFAGDFCWKEEAIARLSLEPVVRQSLLDKGIEQPPQDVIGMLIARMIAGERTRLLRN